MAGSLGVPIKRMLA